MTFLQRIWSKWKQFGRWMGDNVARGVFTLFYFIIALPFGLIAKLGSDFSRKKSPTWLPRVESDNSLEAARRLF